MNVFKPGRFLLMAVAVAWPAAHGATHAEVMASRYMRYQFCMEKTYGQGVDFHLEVIH
jgi:hypothetical protein